MRDGMNILPHPSSLIPRPSRSQTVQQMIANAHRIGDDGQRRVDRRAGNEEAAVNNVKVVQIVRLAVDVEGRAFRVAAEADRAALMGCARNRDLLAQVERVLEEVLVQTDVTQEILQLRLQA